MRKPISIFFTFLILGISMQLGIATHFCGSELAQVKMVYGYGKAGCGMDCNIPSNIPYQQDARFQKLSCCQDFVFILSPDEYHLVSQNTLINTCQGKFPAIKHFYIPDFLVVHTSITNIPPPHTTEVHLPIIQVFLI